MSPEDSDNDFAEELAAFDEALTGGKPVRSLHDPVDGAPEERLRRAQDCLRLLATIWPASSDAPAPAGARGAGPVPPRLGRFDVEWELGRGGFGIVYAAFDPTMNQRLAVKLLHRTSPEAVGRFKQEFRSLADLVHPNLVAPYELIAVEGRWLIAMERIEGSDFLQYVRPGGDRVDEARLRAALAELVAGVAALHEAGILHRDLKPSNVLATAEGKIKILDCGLATHLAAQDPRPHPYLVGTTGYLAPEQATARSLGPACDWFSVGVMLFVALTGRFPPRAKREDESDGRHWPPPATAEWLAAAPPDLRATCVELLRLRPEDRPDGAELQRRLGPATTAAAAGRGRAAADVFVGRARHLAFLREALHDSRDGLPMTVFVRGPSGIGKSALIERFLTEVRQQGEATVFAGRCHERESIPYKAIDPLVDAMARRLRTMPAAEVAALLPADVAFLARLFPVLGSVPDVKLARNWTEVSDPVEVRRRAFRAARALVAALARQAPLVLAIDDMQWSDVDSGLLLTELLAPPDVPSFLLIVGHRDDDAAASPVLAMLADPGNVPGAASDRRVLHVGPLDPEETRTLSGALLGGASSPEAEEMIVKESGGIPFFARELARHANAGERSRGSEGRPGLAEALWSRIDDLPSNARVLLEAVAVAGRPLALTDAFASADLAGERLGALKVLLNGHLARTMMAGGAAVEIETYHARIREVIAGRLEPGVLRQRHRRLAETLEAGGRADPEWLIAHFQGAGDRDKAGAYSVTAADGAAAVLAFDRAARLYRLALDLRQAAAAEERHLRRKLGESLANAGRGGEAAAEYLRAAQGAPASTALDLRRHAAEQYFRGGRFDEGSAALDVVLRAVGTGLAKSSRRAFWSLLLGRLVLCLRGFRFRLRAPAEVSARDRARLEVYRATVLSLALTDNIQNADFGTWYLLLALRAGDPYHLALALVQESCNRYVEPSQRPVARRLLRTARRLANRSREPYVRAFATAGRGQHAVVTGRWREAVRACDAACAILRDRCVGVANETVAFSFYATTSLFFLGELAELSRRRAALLKEARERGDVFAISCFANGHGNALWLAADDPAGAREELRDTMAAWSVRGFHVQHFWCLLAEINVDLYQEDAVTAWERLQAAWPELARSGMLRLQIFRIEAWHLRARCALALLAAGKGSAGVVAGAEKDARGIEREGMPWSAPLVHVIRAQAADVWMRSQTIVNPARMTAMLAPGIIPGQNSPRLRKES